MSNTKWPVKNDQCHHPDSSSLSSRHACLPTDHVSSVAVRVLAQIGVHSSQTFLSSLPREERIERQCLHTRLPSTVSFVCCVYFGDPVKVVWVKPTPKHLPLYLLLTPVCVSISFLSLLLTSVLLDVQHPRWRRSTIRKSGYGNIIWNGPAWLSPRQGRSKSRARTEPTTITTTIAAIDAETKTKTKSRSPWIELHQCSRPALSVRQRNQIGFIIISKDLQRIQWHPSKVEHNTDDMIKGLTLCRRKTHFSANGCRHRRMQTMQHHQAETFNSVMSFRNALHLPIITHS